MHSPSGITFRVPMSMRQTVSPCAEIVQDGLAAIVESLQKRLPPGESVFAPIFRLSPHETPFDEPIDLLVPTCVGARTVWRSTRDGWEELCGARFENGCAKIQLSHFCDLAVTGEKSPMKAIGFVNSLGDTSIGKLVVCHIGCTHCEKLVKEVHSNDPDLLLHYLKCKGCAQIGTRENDCKLQVAQNMGLVTMSMDLDFVAFPVVSDELQAEPTGFEVDIEKKAQIFKVPKPTAASTAPLAAPLVLPTRLCSQNARLFRLVQAVDPSAGSQDVSAEFCRDVHMIGCLDSKHLLQNSFDNLCLISIVGGASCQGPGVQCTSNNEIQQAGICLSPRFPCLLQAPQSLVSAESLVRSPPSSCRLQKQGQDARVGMFSARFDGGDMEQRFRVIHQILRENHYDVMMVSARGGESFGTLTAQYLNRLHDECGAMLAVCTKTYGEVTDSEYSSHAELKFALTYGKRVRVLPLRVEDTYPPEPPGGPGHPFDEQNVASGFVKMVFSKDRVYVDCRDKSPMEIAAAIADCLHD